MSGFRLWLEGVKVNLPSVRQNHDWDCGAACLRAVCEYFKTGPEKEADFIRECGTGEGGTKPAGIVRAAKKFGLGVKAESGMSVKDLQRYLDGGVPVICCVQAYGDGPSYQKKQSGHYVVVIGHGAGKVYVEDPWMKGTRGYMPQREFESRWKDKDVDGKEYVRYGIALWKAGDKEPECVGKAKKVP